jgi:hypothetical protein
LSKKHIGLALCFVGEGEARTTTQTLASQCPGTLLYKVTIETTFENVHTSHSPQRENPHANMRSRLRSRRKSLLAFLG